MLALPNGDVIAGGNFTNAGGQPAADYVARWDGHRWLALGTGPGHFSFLTALIAAPHDQLLVAGIEYLAAGHARSLVRRWNGVHWQQVGPDLPDQYVTALAVAANGDVLAGLASSPGCGVLRWQGHAWQPLTPDPAAGTAAPGRGSRLTTLLVTPGGTIVALGRFPATPPNNNQEAVCWTGTGWQALGPPAQGLRQTFSLALSASGDVLASGVLISFPYQEHYFVARWDGQQWQPLPTTLPGVPGQLLASPAGEVAVVYKTYTSYPATTTTTIARWDGVRWQARSLGKAASNYRRTVLAVAANGDLLVSDPIYSLLGWNGRAWYTLADGQSAGFAGGRHAGSLTALAVAASGAVVLAGAVFDDAPDTLLPHRLHPRVYRWDGQQRRPLGPALSGEVRALAVAATGEVLAGGRFALPGAADSIHNVARWDGHAWQPLGQGQPPVQALALAANGDIIVGGNETLNRWDGHRWQPLPLPCTGVGAHNYVAALAVAPNGDLVVGGQFMEVPRAPDDRVIERSVMRWNGHTWQALGSRSYRFPQSLALLPDSSVVLGTGITYEMHDHWQESGEVQHLSQAGEQRLGDLLGSVRAVAITANGDIIAGGDFEGHLLRWSGTAWQPLGTGLNDAVRALAVAPSGDLVVGGDFSITGDGSQSLSLWGIYRP